MASKGINKVILIGHLGQNPDLRYTASGNPVINLSIATSENWKDKQTGDIKEKTEWHRVVIFGKIAEIAAEYLKKGSQVYIEGSLQTRKWKDASGIEKYTTEIIVNINGTLQILGNKNKNNTENNDNKILNKNENVKNQKINKNETISSSLSNSSIISEFDDDIPF